MYDEDLEAREMAQPHVPSQDEADQIYDQYVRPLEDRYWGKYVAVSWQGDIVMAITLVEVAQKAVAAFGKGNSIAFRVGDRVVGRIR
jgi:hypothetical protein